MTYRHASLAALVLALTACASSHDAPPLEPEPLTVVTVASPPELPPVMTSLESCLLAGGALVEAGAVHNDDTRPHGAIWSLAVAADRRIAVAADDGSIKLWTLDGFLGELEPGAFLYGAEVEGAQVPALAFLDDMVIAGDVRGVVSAWQEDGFPRIVGGTDPDVRIVAVAVEPTRRWVAHADETEGGRVMVRGLSDPVTFGPLPTTLDEVSGLAFADGGLLVAGSVAGRPALERFALDAPERVAAQLAPSAAMPVAAIAASRGGETVAFVTADAVGAADAALGERWLAAGALVPVSVDVTAMGGAVLAADAGGWLRAFAGADGRPLARVSVAAPVAVRVDTAGDLAIVASEDGWIRAFACAR
ncbi:MAG: hypothetical protein KF729_35045 [Sandaracinaceae bacterium]|nr:hypothetical protein [Sandaracinaceae bacterium]